jgi:uncharacterized protein (DUF58 family)
VTASVSSRLGGLLMLAGGGLVAGLAAGRPELAVLAVPFLVLAGVGLALADEPQLDVALGAARCRLLEGDRVTVSLTVRSRGRQAVDVKVELHHSAQIRLTPQGPISAHLGAGEAIELACVVRAERWGAHAVGPVTIVAQGRSALTEARGQMGERLILRVFPREPLLRQLIAPARTQPFLGTHVARAAGEGIEFADIRPFMAGDRVRHVNWRATARRGSLHVTQRHPEHASDVVLLLDTFAEARDDAGGTLDDAVRAAASLARRCLARRDRVALVDLGGALQWLEPAFGTAQMYRIIDALLSSEIAFSYAWRHVDSIPRRLLPPAGLIVAITPLLDERSIRLITDLRTRSYDVTAVEVSPLARVPQVSGDAHQLAHRLWRLQRAALRARLRGLGIGVAVWGPGAELAPAVEGVNAFRRSARPAARA